MSPDPAVVLAELRAFRARSAAELRAYARQLLDAADLLDPPAPGRRRARKSLPTAPAESPSAREDRAAPSDIRPGGAALDDRLDGPQGVRAAGLQLDLGTGGRTTRLDPDADVVVENLVYATEGGRREA